MYKELIKAAENARKNAYCPYSQFAVGAALCTCGGKIYTGCNIENSAGTSNCAERTAIYKAVSDGYKEFKAIAIVGGSSLKDQPEEYCYPCGVCRQVMAEFCDGSFEVICAKSTDEYKVHTLNELIPYAFTLIKQ